MIAHVCNLKPGNLYISLGDAHIYLNHLNQIKEQVKRKHYECPICTLNQNIKHIDQFKFEDIQITEYHSHPAIKATMAV